MLRIQGHEIKLTALVDEEEVDVSPALNVTRIFSKGEIVIHEDHLIAVINHHRRAQRTESP